MNDHNEHRQDDGQGELLSVPKTWEQHWNGMPQYEQKNLMPWQTVRVHFRSEQDRAAFSKLIGQTVTELTKFVWYPKAEHRKVANVRYENNSVMPQFPIYIVSKGRADSRLTSKALEAMRVPYFIIVEEQEFDVYASVIDKNKILVLEKRYQRDYDTFDDLGDSKSKGPGAARNFAWDHSLSRGAEWHWVMDDNISNFLRLNKNLKVKVSDGAIFKLMEDFCLRYSNVAMAGPNYDFLAKRKQLIPPFILNTRIYSCNLIRNDLPYRWRGRYNEDTDLSLRILKDGFCTVQFNAFLQAKATTQTTEGGCNADFYQKEGTLPKSEMLAKMHPDVTRLVFKFSRAHHHVDYRQFEKNKLILRDDAQVTPAFDISFETIEPEKRAPSILDLEEPPMSNEAWKR